MKQTHCRPARPVRSSPLDALRECECECECARPLSAEHGRTQHPPAFFVSNEQPRPAKALTVINFWALLLASSSLIVTLCLFQVRVTSCGVDFGLLLLSYREYRKKKHFKNFSRHFDGSDFGNTVEYMPSIP